MCAVEDGLEKCLGRRGAVNPDTPLVKFIKSMIPISSVVSGVGRSSATLSIFSTIRFLSAFGIFDSNPVAQSSSSFFNPSQGIGSPGSFLAFQASSISIWSSSSCNSLSSLIETIAAKGSPRRVRTKGFIPKSNSVQNIRKLFSGVCGCYFVKHNALQLFVSYMWCKVHHMLTFSMDSISNLRFTCWVKCQNTAFF